MHDNDQVMRDFVATLAVPELEDHYTAAPPLAEARVAIVTSAALSRPGGVGKWEMDDFHFETIPSDARDLELGHLSPNFDRSGFHADLNVVYPIDRLEELAARGTIGSVASHHYAFAGNQPEGLSELRLDTGPACAEKLKEDGVDVVLLTPV